MAESVLELGKKARAAALEMAVCGIEERNNALLAMADALIAHKAQILAANERDIKAAKEKGLKAAFVERLTLNDKRVEGMAQ